MLILGALTVPAGAEEATPKLPKNTINCAQFKKTGPKEWTEAGTAVFDLGSVGDINLTGQPVTPGFFKFDGIDLYPVLEQKCGAAGPDAAEPLAPGVTAQPVLAAGEKTPSPEPSPAPPAPVQEAAPPNALKTARNEAGGACGGGKSVYAAQAPADGAGDGASIEFAFESKTSGEGASEFLIRKTKNGEQEWVYKGRMRQGRFIFAAAVPRETNNGGRFTLASAPPVRTESVSLTPDFIKPNRDGTGEAILYVHGLRWLFASREDSRRFKFEGKRPAGPLPEIFYFERCE
jgi:hypothetical protein